MLRERRERNVSQGTDGIHHVADVFPGCCEGAPCASAGTDRVNAKGIALADAELCHHDVVFPLGNFSDRLDMTKETKWKLTASHSLLKFPATLRLIVRLLIPRKGENLKFE